METSSTTPQPCGENPSPHSSNEAYPTTTTFVTADTSSFKQVVQMLTGSSNASKTTSQSSRSFVIPPMKTAAGKKQQQAFKLYERRNTVKNNLLMISPLTGHHQNASFKPPEILSPSILDFPALTLSPITPLSAAGEEDQSDKSSHSEEEKAIAEKGFYLHPSPMSTPRGGEPQLLPLFPVTSPRVSDPSSSAT